MMDPKLKAEWIAALRGGNYRQTRHRLKTDKGHCCLGVLVEIANIPTIEKPIPNRARQPEEIGLTIYEGAEIIQWEKKLGLPTEFAYELAKDNDAGKTFAEIADKLEATTVC